MRIFMLGWEFPPFISGGLGTACYGLTKAMSQLDMKVFFVLPKKVDRNYTTHVKLLSPDAVLSSKSFTSSMLKNITFRMISSSLQPYSTPTTYQQQVGKTLKQEQKLTSTSISPGSQSMTSTDYSSDMYTEVYRYALIAAELAKTEQVDIVHAHDWMTYLAGIRVAKMTRKPLIVHVHSTEFDRSGEHVNQTIYDIERKGMHTADKVIAVSNLTRDIIIRRYGVPAEKVEVVHNGVERNSNGDWTFDETSSNKGEKVVLFLGRMTMQKGPEYFLQAAKKVLQVMDNVKFIMAGSGDLMHRMVEMAAGLGIGGKVLFTGFLRGGVVHEAYKMADVFVMPSVSEPFGLVPLEALDNDVPVIISKQSGVSEVLRHALKVDFWDVDELANKIMAVLKYPPLKITLRDFGNSEVRRLQWKDSAAKCAKIYEEALVANGSC